MHEAADHLIGNASRPVMGFSGIVSSLVPAYYRILCETELRLRREYWETSPAALKRQRVMQAQQAMWVVGARQPLILAWVTTVGCVLVTPLAAVSDSVARAVARSADISHGAHLGGMLAGCLLLPKQSAACAVTLDANAEQVIMTAALLRIAQETARIAGGLFVLRFMRDSIRSGLAMAKKGGGRR
jgi:hypothetical protein